MREVVTTLLDAVALLLVGAGAAAAVAPRLGWASLLVAGLVIGLGSGLSARLASAAQPVEGRR